MEKEILMIARGIKKSNHQWETPRGEREEGNYTAAFDKKIPDVRMIAVVPNKRCKGKHD